ncbi:MAG: hypothetical protein Q7T73_03375 [Beijerinckiaceae bacterium]|nr:hypothetical protein [Beijerinckiaceae bacterium]
MTDGDLDVAGTAREPGEPADAAFFAVLIGLASCAAAVVSGLVLALDKVVIGCPDGTEFPNGTTDFNCYSDPDAELGFSIVAIAFAVGAAIVLLRAVLRAVRAPQLRGL